MTKPVGIREQIDQKSKALVKRTSVTLPETGVTVAVRTLMSGDLLRVQALSGAEQGIATVAFAVEDPGNPGVPVYNWNDLTHRDEIAGWHHKDLFAVVEAHNKLMGLSPENPQTADRSSSTASPSASESPRES